MNSEVKFVSGIVAGIIAAIVVLVILAAVVSAGIAVLVGTIVAGLVAGFIVDGSRRNGAVVGLLSGIIYPIFARLVLSVVQGSSFDLSAIVTGNGIFGFLLTGVIGLVGGFIGQYLSKKSGK